MVYALSFFLFLSGVWRQHPRLMALSLIVVFLYGSLIWGLFPIEPHMSYEGHLTGALAGGVIAWFYRHKPPQRKKFEWPLEEEDEEIQEQPETSEDASNLSEDANKATDKSGGTGHLRVVYTVVKEKKDEQ